MIALHITRPDISWLELSEWFDLLLMADAMGWSIALAFNESALSLISDDSEVVKKLKAFSYTDLKAVWISGMTISASSGSAFKGLDMAPTLLSQQDFEHTLNAQSWVITL